MRPISSPALLRCPASPRHPASSAGRAGAVRPPLLIAVVLAACLLALALHRFGGTGAPPPREKPPASSEEPRAAVDPGEPAPDPGGAGRVATAELATPAAAADTRPRRIPEGHVVDGVSGEPVQRFELKAYPGPPPRDPALWEDCFTLNNSGPAGDFGLGFLEPGTYTLRVRAKGFADTFVEGFENPTLLRDVVIRMEHGRWIHGTLRDGSGAPVDGLAVRLLPASRGARADGRDALETRTDAAGEYHFSGIGEGPWRVELSGMRALMREVPASEPLSPAEGEELVWDPPLEDLVTVDLAIDFDAERFVFARLDARLRTAWGTEVLEPLVNDKARFRFVPPGIYEVTITRRGETTPWYGEYVEIPADQPVVALERTVKPPERQRPAVDPTRIDGKKRGGRRGKGDR